MENNPCAEIALAPSQFCAIAFKDNALKFKIGDKVIFRLRATAEKIHVGIIVNITTQRHIFPYHLEIEGHGKNNLARESELTLWTELNEALL